MLRRDVASIVAAHKLDPERRELYVEGRQDAAFLSVLVRETKDPNTIIQVIGAVDLPIPGGGERGRLIEFARQVEELHLGIAFFADQDVDMLLGRAIPSNGWLTDGRDLESYLLQPEAFLKLPASVVSLAEEQALHLLEELLREAKRLGILRVYSAVNDLALPFQVTDFRRCVSGEGTTIAVDVERYVKTLCQNCGRSLSTVATITEGLASLEASYGGVDPLQLVHGKDALHLLDIVLRRLDRRFSSRALWLAFERSMTGSFPRLTEVIGFLENA
jgi:hypothetical protein